MVYAPPALLYGMLQLKTLLRATPHPVRVRALLQCRTTVTRAILETDEFGNRRKNVAALVRATDGDRFCTIMFYDPTKTKLVESRVWLSCSCGYFTFTVETVNALHKSSDVINSNGDLPVIRNPRMIPHLCKHLVALAKFAIIAKAKEVDKKAPKRGHNHKPEYGVPVPHQRDNTPGVKTYTKKPVSKVPKKPLAKPHQPPKKPGKPLAKGK